MPRYSDDEQLKVKSFPSFEKGYNSYTAGKSTVDDKEIPYGQNVVLDNNGSVTKVAGFSKFSSEIASGKAVTGMGILKNPTYNKVIVACGTAWYSVTLNGKTALTGKTFVDSKPTDFMQAGDRLYGANGLDSLGYTTDGQTIVSPGNGNVGRWPTFYNQRIYMTNTANPDRIYYSNPYSIDLTANPPTISWTDFGTFDTNLSATPKKTAGYITLMPGGGVEITCIKADNSGGTDYLFVYTKKHGIWRISYASVNSDGSIAHNVVQIITSSGTPSGRSVAKFMNDTWFFSGDNFNTYGEVAQYQSTRLTNKSGRIRTEINSVSAAYKNLVALGVYKDKLFISYPVGTYNDTMLIYDSKFNAWSSPIKNRNISCFLEWEDDNGNTYFLGGSSDPSKSYVYQLESGTNNDTAGIDAFFETKSTDCDKPGLIKRFGFIDVFYTMVYGELTYEVFIDEQSSITGQLSLGNSTSRPLGIGTMKIGTFPIGKEYDPNTTFASLAQNNNFRIDCGYNPGKKISVRFTNNNTNEQFKIDSLAIYYLPGEIYEQ